jgi:tRNA A58 N-methylase Trm61
MGARDRPQQGDLVVLVTGHSNLQTAYLEAGKMTQNKFGSFSHDEMLASPYGTKIWSRDRKGFIMM